MGAITYRNHGDLYLKSASNRDHDGHNVLETKHTHLNAHKNIYKADTMKTSRQTVKITQHRWRPQGKFSGAEANQNLLSSHILSNPLREIAVDWILPANKK